MKRTGTAGRLGAAVAPSAPHVIPALLARHLSRRERGAAREERRTRSTTRSTPTLDPKTREITGVGHAHLAQPLAGARARDAPAPLPERVQERASPTFMRESSGSHRGHKFNGALHPGGIRDHVVQARKDGTDLARAGSPTSTPDDGRDAAREQGRDGHHACRCRRGRRSSGRRDGDLRDRVGEQDAARLRADGPRRRRRRSSWSRSGSRSPVCGSPTRPHDGGEPVWGWNCHQFHGSSEFYADYGTSTDVRMTVPERFESKVGATRLRADMSGGAREGKSRKDDGRHDHLPSTWPKHVHDFAWVCGARTSWSRSPRSRVPPAPARPRPKSTRSMRASPRSSAAPMDETSTLDAGHGLPSCSSPSTSTSYERHKEAVFQRDHVPGLLVREVPVPDVDRRRSRSPRDGTRAGWSTRR